MHDRLVSRRTDALHQCFLFKYLHTQLCSLRPFLLNFRSTITKTRLYIFDLNKPHFYIVKLGFTGVYIIFLIFAQNIYSGTR